MEEAENEMQGWTQVPFEFEDSPMTKIVMIKMPDGFNGVYFLGHHMVVDAQSLIAFFKRILLRYTVMPCMREYLFLRICAHTLSR